MMVYALLLAIQMNTLIKNNNHANYVQLDVAHVLVLMFVQHVMMDIS